MQVGHPGISNAIQTSYSYPGCKCIADPDRRHGLYCLWAKSVTGKKVSCQLALVEFELFLRGIANRRQLQRVFRDPQSVKRSQRDCAAPGE